MLEYNHLKIKDQKSMMTARYGKGKKGTLIVPISAIHSIIAEAVRQRNLRNINASTAHLARNVKIQFPRKTIETRDQIRSYYGYDEEFNFAEENSTFLGGYTKVTEVRGHMVPVTIAVYGWTLTYQRNTANSWVSHTEGEVVRGTETQLWHVNGHGEPELYYLSNV